MKWTSETHWRGQLGDVHCSVLPYTDGLFCAFGTWRDNEASTRLALAVTLGAAINACERYAAQYAFVAFLARMGAGIETRDKCDTCARHSCYRVHDEGVTP